MQLKYHDTGKEKDCLPQVGQWNMMNKVYAFIYQPLPFLSIQALSFPLLVKANAQRPDLHFPHVIQKMINGMTVNRWACINFSRSVQESVARGFCSELAQMCQVSGMVIFGLILSWFFKFTMLHFIDL